MPDARFLQLDDPDTLLLPCSKMLGQRLKNHHGEVIGRLCSLVIDLKTGRICYGVLAYVVPFHIVPRLFAVPWHALILDADHQSFELEVEISELKRLPGFDPRLWPNSADPVWQRKIDGFYSSNS